MMKLRLLALLACIMLLWMPAVYAEEMLDLTTVQPLVDQAVADRLLSEALLEADGYIGMQTMASEMSDDDRQLTLYGDLYQAEAALDTLPEEKLTSVTWLGKRAVVTLCKDDAATGGWRVEGLQLEHAAVTPGAMEDQFGYTMVEYMNAELGFSLQYPAVFADETVVEDAEGVSAALADGTASFYARRRANEAAALLTDGLAMMQAKYPQAQVSMDEISQTVYALHQREDGQSQADMLIVTEAWIYEAQLCFTQEKAEEFELYVEYMRNSFMADELGIG